MIEPILDVSRWQGNIDEKVMLSSNVRGLIIRLGSIDYNGPYEDFLFRENHAKFEDELPCGYYWYFRPEYSGVRQGEYVVERLDELKIPLRLPMVPDVEENAKSLSKAEFWYELLSFINVFIENGYTKIADYTRGWFWNENLGNPAGASDQLLGIARYSTVLTHPWGDSDKFRPLPWNDWWWWQKSADGNGLGPVYGCDSDDVDYGLVNMTEDEWKIFTAEDVAPSSFLCNLGDFLIELGNICKKGC